MTEPAPPKPLDRVSQVEFIFMIAALMALNALAIDVMLPALGEILADYGLPPGNMQQWVVIAYVLGFGAPQLIYGPLCDAFGRRPVLLASLVGYTAISLLCLVAPSFGILLALRAVQGAFAAGCRVGAVSMVRDLFEGRAMARIMSFVLTIFMVVPVLAPGLGEIVLWLTGHWTGPFWVLVLVGGIMLAWVGIRMPETLAEENRRTLDLKSSFEGYLQVLSYPVTRGYLIASGIIFGGLFAFIASAEQIFKDVFGIDVLFTVCFAFVAAALGVTNLLNARLVEKFGMRPISHGALVAYTALSSLLLILLLSVGQAIWIFLPLFAMIFGLFGLMGANFSALAMEPLGKIAGSGAAAYGFITSTLSMILGLAIGQQFNETVYPITIGMLVLGVATLLTVWITDRAKMFKAR